MKKKYVACIALIDDDPDTLELMAAFFRNFDFQTILYSDANLAFEDITNAKISCDVIVTDLNMPNLSGIEFTKKMKEIESNIPIIVVTAIRKVETAVEAIHVGAYDFLVKPLHLAQLLVSVQRALYLVNLQQDNETLKSVVNIQQGPANVNGIIGKSPSIRLALDLARRVSAYSTNVLISGESGTGKEVIARAIHNLGPRKNLPFVAINCAAIPDSLLESEFFGHAKGSFTGAFEKKIGLFEEAGEGTLFLDEIGDLNLPLQAKILRVLQERKIRRIGENQYRPFRARIVAATNCNLRIEVENKRFREDLFFRLNVIPIWIAPLRKRKEDILPLAEFFLKKYCVMNGLVGKRFTKECKEAMLGFQWQGNVRELENFVERALILSNSDSIDAVDLVNTVETTERPDSFSSTLAFEKISQDRVLSIDEMANHYISYVLDLNEGAKDKAAKDLGIDRKTLYRRLKDIEILRIQGKKANALLPAQI